MNTFDSILGKLLENPSEETVIKVYGKPHTVKAMVRLTTKNMFPDEYIKIIFYDGAFMLIMIADEEIYFSGTIIGHIDEIADADIGLKQELRYKDKIYTLGNKDDYQYVIRLYVGTPFDIEGECRFSDYFSTQGEKEFLSLGFLSSTNERADINPVYVDISEIELI
jgi:hypothetical protein